MGDVVTLDKIDMTDKYILPRSQVERGRLESQHGFITELLGGRLIVDKNVKLGPEARALDAGTGAASWLLDLVKVVPETTELVGTDISSALFPKELPANVKLYEMSTLNLPTDWSSSFDLANHRLLAAAFTMEQWRTSISELFRVLKPGGAIQFMEYGHYGALHDSDALPAMSKAMDMTAAIMKKRGILGRDSGIKLPGMLQEAGFSDIQVEVLRAPVGRQWGEMGEIGRKNLNVILRGVGAALLAEGGLGVCESQAEVDKIIQDAMEVCNETAGLFVPFYAITARKAT